MSRIISKDGITAAIRPIAAGELPEALELLDSVFMPNQSSGGTLRERTPTLLDPGNAQNLYAAYVDDKIVSFAGYKPIDIRYRGMALNAAMIGAVATHPDYRGMGLSSGILQSMETGMRDTLVDFSALWSASPAFYRRYGWEYLGIEWLCTITAQGKPEGKPARVFAGDYERLHTLRNRSDYLFTRRTPQETTLLLKNSRIRNALETDDGYVVYEALSDRVNVLESGGSVDTLPALVGDIMRREGKPACVMQLSPGDPRVRILQTNGYAVDCAVRPAAMYRVERRDLLLEKFSGAGIMINPYTPAERIFGSPEHGDAPLAAMCINWLDHV